MNKKRKNRKKKKSKILKIFALLILIVVAIVFALVSPIFSIETITVQGNEKIASETIMNLSELNIGENIFRNRASEIAKRIKEESYIENVKVKRKLPDTVEISVEEREIAYQVNVIDSYIYIDYQGYILEKSVEAQKVPILEGLRTEQDDLLNGKRLCSDDINYLNTFLKIVENAKKLDLYESITKIIVENNEYVIYFKKQKKYAYLGNSTDITNKMLYVKAIMKKEKNSGRIFVNGDLNSGFKPFFREE